MSPSEFDGSWSVYQCQAGNDVMLARVRTGIDFTKRKMFSTVIEIIWPMESSSGVSLSDLEQTDMEQFEDILSPLFSGQHSSILTHVLTGEGRRVWIVYSTSLPVFMKAFNSLLRSCKVLPIEIKAGTDVNWKEYDAALSLANNSSD